MQRKERDGLVGHCLHSSMTIPSLPSSNDSATDDPSSPALFFYTPPTSPPASTPDLYFTPPSSPYHHSPVPQSDSVSSDYFLSDSDYDDTVPTDAAIDLALDEEGLTTLEKVYLYSRSKAYHHRIFIVHELHHYLDHVSPQEAVEYVLPLLSGLAMDEGASPCL